MPDKLKKLEDLIKLVNESISREEFVKAFEAAIKQILQIEQNLIKKIDAKTQQATDTLAEIEKIHKEVIAKIKEENSSSFSNMKKWAMEQVSTLFAKYQIKEKIAELDKKMSEVKDGKDGLPGKDGKDGSPDNPEIVRDKLETLTGNERLEIKAIKDLQEKLDELKKSAGGRFFGGGGFSKIAWDLHYIDDESPVDSGDATNFTINHTPSPASSLKLYRGGARQRITTDYTLSGRTITLLVPLVAGEILLADYKI